MVASPGMVVCPQPLAAEEGVKVLRQGGNAIDAAVTVAACQGVLDPQNCGIGGSGLMLIHGGDSGRCEVIEFLARAGAGVRTDMWEPIFSRESEDQYNFVVEGAINDVGYTSVAIPGTVAGLALALQRHGTISWAEALAPAIRFARGGFPIPGALVSSWTRAGTADQVSMADRLRATVASRRVYTNRGQLKQLGEELVQDDYARTLEILARDGPQAFYVGEVGELIAHDFEYNGGYIARDDLANYRAITRAPLEGTYRGFTIVTVPPPAGGVALMQMLNFLEGYDLASSGWTSTEAARWLVQAMQWAFSDRGRYLGDPAYWPMPVDDLLDKTYAEKARQLSSPRLDKPSTSIADAPTTTHVNVVDQYGHAVSLTHTLGSSSGVVTDGLGFMYNNYLNCFDPRPGRPNSIGPGKTRVTMMSPTFVFSGSQLRAIVGAPGGTRIVTAVLQTLVNVLDHQMTAVEAVSAPRVDLQADLVQVEGRIPTSVVEGLRGAGYGVIKRAQNYDSYFGLAQLILIGADGAVSGASDPRNDGGVAYPV